MVARRVWVNLTLDNRSEAYQHFCIWMEDNNMLSKTQHMRMTDDDFCKVMINAPETH